MSERYIDGILAYIDGMITNEYRDTLIAELKDVDETIKLCTAQIEKWSYYARRTETERDVPEDLRKDTIAILARKEKLLKSAQHYRAHIIYDLHNQPKNEPEIVRKQ